MPRGYVGPITRIPCKTCGNLFRLPPCMVGKRSHCSKACRLGDTLYVPTLSCLACGKSFTPIRSNWLKGYGKHCSMACGRVTRGLKSRAATESRFWARVQKSDGCWDWTGARYPKGYGRFCIDRGKHILASHYAWQLSHGPVPPGMLVCHTCDRPQCVRVDHLFLGTHADNSADMVAKARHVHGEKCFNAVLTDEIVRDARRRYQARQSTMAALAREYGVRLGTLKCAVNGWTWNHVTP